MATNYHVIEGASSGFAKIVGGTSTYRIEGTVGIDKSKDLALLKLTGANGKPLGLADISQIEVGQEVFALGNPRALEGTISPGIISGMNLREVDNENLIQITAPISAGSSGGPVVNKKGEVVGVAVASLRNGQNLNFAVPASYLAILLASSKNVTLLSELIMSSTEKPSISGPTLAETTQWLTSKLEGTKFVITKPPSTTPSVETVTLFRFSGCTMNFESSNRQGKYSTTFSTKASLSWIVSVFTEIEDKEKNDYVILRSNRKIKFILLFWDGDSQIVSTDLIRMPVSDSDTAQRAVKAFNQLIKLCKEETKNEPF